MSTVITPDYLRDCSVEAVRAYITSQVPLTDSVVSIAQRDKLSPEQIARVVEVVNQVAYLKLLDSAKDRTFEFKLADLEDVTEKIMSPKSTPADLSTHDSPFNVFKEDVIKSAGEADEGPEMSEQERHVLIMKAYHGGLADMEKLAHEERELIFSLSSHLVRCRKDAEILEKVAYITDGESEAIRDVSKMVYGHSKEASYDQAFYEDDLQDARTLVRYVAHAHEILEKKAALQESLDKAQGYMKHVAKTGWTGLKNTGNRAKAAMPGGMGVLSMAPFYEPSSPVMSLHKNMPDFQ